MATLKDAMRSAFEAVGQELPKVARSHGSRRAGKQGPSSRNLATAENSSGSEEGRDEEPPVSDRVILAKGGHRRPVAAVTVNYGKSLGRPDRPPRKAPSSVQSPAREISAGGTPRPGAQQPNGQSTLKTSSVRSSEQRPTPPKLPLSNERQVQQGVPGIEVTIGTRPQCLVRLEEASRLRPILNKSTLTSKEQLCRSSVKDMHDVTLGLDFGTSSLKVVIGDASLERAFAVPFFADGGIDAFLLPSRLYETIVDHDPVFSLFDGERVHRDLKLGLLANPDSMEHRERVIALFALVIRHARSWLFREHKEIYEHCRVVWRMAVGFPSISALNEPTAGIYAGLARAAWNLAGEQGPVRLSAIRSATATLGNPLRDDEELEIEVIPEIAAQIYGFVFSNTFDKNATNRYLLVDVGAGTIDAALFRVMRARGGRWDFEFYTAVVQPNGVANLHSYRVDWWTRALRDEPDAQCALTALETTRFATDMKAALPETYAGYFEDIRVSLEPKTVSPDAFFFKRRVLAQVSGQTLWRAWKDRLLEQADLTRLPMFVCGGGARMPFYLALEEELPKAQGTTWLSAEPWMLGLPGDLECDGVDQADFDRLSVAYGLSKLNVGKVVRALPAPKVIAEPSRSWTDRYVDKDQV